VTRLRIVAASLALAMCSACSLNFRDKTLVLYPLREIVTDNLKGWKYVFHESVASQRRSTELTSGRDGDSEHQALPFPSWVGGVSADVLVVDG
jgi:hypothetical protein